MGFIIVMVLLGLLVASFLFIVGMKVNERRRADAAPLNKAQQEEYALLLTMRTNIQVQAPEHIALGDSFARIALDEANATFRREIR
jgi:uncharacterized SAM-binding protein YcdF (DUF218 family)